MRRLLLLLGALAFAVTAEAAKAPDAVRVEKLIVEATNGLRAAEGRSPVARDAKLSAVAQSFADYMARTGRFDHDADGRSSGDRARQGGYAWCFIAENIAYEHRTSGFTTQELADAFVADWKGSAGHRRNMLNRDAADIGVAIAQAKNGHWYAVQMFGRRCR